MRGGEFGAEVRQHDGTGIIDLHGEIDLAADGPLCAAYDEAVRGDPKGVVLNFAHVDYMDSTGIALIVGLLARTRRDGRDLFAYGLTDHYREIFAITRLSDFIWIYRDEDSAVVGAGVPAEGGQR